MKPPTLDVLRLGLLATVQDLGRPGLAHLGVPRSGAADRDSLLLGNRLLGNPPDAAGIEATALGLDVRLDQPRWIAVTGATCRVSIAGRPADLHAPQYVPAGATLSIGRAENGIRTYLAVAGGIACPPVLHSRSTDTLSGIGPAPLAAGTVLPLGPAAGDPAPVDIAPRARIPETAWVRLVLGPRDDWFAGDTIDGLFAATYQVSTASNRVGVRLDGPEVPVRHSGGLPSEGMVLGAVQIPASGKPIVFLADHPTTGGYPVVGVVHPDDLWMMAQAAPGTRVRFRRVATPPTGTVLRLAESARHTAPVNRR
ncbi:allophanate hydrolase [Rugosimonospora africana]|uniref:Allophanate hydrolase n=1 Tax=Rugosimonospora africana TaxID=556532 RepID=A0A8J3QN49_9ACTN|nr:biotin-dependent carboxyltransferase family protein [Rugosimonospora africana]GIH12979.1 allophanate hydrolase [Rugosimonospora africana]